MEAMDPDSEIQYVYCIVYNPHAHTHIKAIISWMITPLHILLLFGFISPSSSFFLHVYHGSSWEDEDHWKFMYHEQTFPVMHQ